MVFTLHRYIFRDLIKTFVITTLVLSVLLGLGVMLRPLKEFSVEPALVPQLLWNAWPITLTMVMPIAALLAATVIYGNLAALNEINACRSSGISLMTLMYPAFTLALLVGTATLLLVFHIIPAYTERFEAILQADAKAIIYRNIEHRGRLGHFFPGMMVHADLADPQNDRLVGVAAVRISPDGRHRAVTARQVAINIERTPQGNQVVLRFQDATVVDEAGTYSVGQLVIARELPNLWRDSIKFKKLADLDRIREDMTLFEPVRRLFTLYRDQWLVECYFQWVDEQLARYQYVTLPQANQQLRVRADQCRLRLPSDGSLVIGSEPRTADLTRAAAPLTVYAQPLGSGADPDERVFYAAAARLTADPDRAIPRAALTLDGVEWHYAGQEAYRQYVERYPLGEVGLPPQLLAEAQNLTLNEVRVAAPHNRLAAPSPQLQAFHGYLLDECRKVEIRIEMERHFRLAFGVSCVVLVALGAGLGIIFKSGHLLTAFAVSFVPAVICFMAISTGKQVAQQSTAGLGMGIAFLWSGVVFVVIAGLAVYAALMRR